MHVSSQERLRPVVQICLAVRHVHEKGIQHRELKPSNLLVPEIDGQAVVKIIDFAIVKARRLLASRRIVVKEWRDDAVIPLGRFAGFGGAL